MRAPGGSGRVQAASTSAKGTLVGVTVIVPVLISWTDHGRSLVSDAAARFEADVSELLERLPSAGRASLAGLVSQLLVAHAADHGIDLFATAPAAPPWAAATRSGMAGLLTRPGVRGFARYRATRGRVSFPR